MVYDCLFSQGQNVSTYTENTQVTFNPFSLPYLGSTQQYDVLEKLKQYDYVIALPDNSERKTTSELLQKHLGTTPLTALHKSAVISRSTQVGDGIVFGPRVVVNPQAMIGHGVILNTGCIIETNVVIDGFAHIDTGALIGHGTHISEGVHVGMGAVILPGITVGKNVVVKPGMVVSEDLPGI